MIYRWFKSNSKTEFQVISSDQTEICHVKHVTVLKTESNILFVLWLDHTNDTVEP